MDKTYIVENGVLEQYVLGELNSSEQRQVEDALHQYPELKETLESIEISFEQLGVDNSIVVPDFVKDKLLNKIKEDTKIKMVSAPEKNYKTYFAIAASIAGLLLASSIYLYSELSGAHSELEIVEQENTLLNESIYDLNSSLSEVNKWYITINDPETEKYVLKGNDLMPEARMISYVNDSKKSVVINTKELPELDDQHNYQMWADVEGVMINMGIIDKSKDMLAMNYVDNAESLNITIEPAGGSDHPDVSQLITNIYLK